MQPASFIAQFTLRQNVNHTQLPDPGRGEPPPGTDGIQTLLEWLAWLVSAASVAGVLAAAIGMAISYQRHGHSAEAISRLGWAMGAAIVGSAAGPLVTALL